MVKDVFLTQNAQSCEASFFLGGNRIQLWEAGMDDMCWNINHMHVFAKCSCAARLLCVLYFALPLSHMRAEVQQNKDSIA